MALLQASLALKKAMWRKISKLKPTTTLQYMVLVVKDGGEFIELMIWNNGHKHKKRSFFLNSCYFTSKVRQMRANITLPSILLVQQCIITVNYASVSVDTTLLGFRVKIKDLQRRGRLDSTSSTTENLIIYNDVFFLRAAHQKAVLLINSHKKEKMDTQAHDGRTHAGNMMMSITKEYAY